MHKRFALYLQDKHDMQYELEIARYAEERGFSEIWQADTRLAQLQPFGYGRYAQPVDADALRHARDRDRAVSVAVGFHGDQDAALWANRLADAFDVEADVVEMNAGVRLVKHLNPS